MKAYISGWTDKNIERIKNAPYYKKKLEALLKRGEKFLESDPPYIKFTDIHNFVLTGDRYVYQGVHEEYRSRMMTFATLYMLTGDDKYIDPLANVLWSICNFESWGLPAHVPETDDLLRRRCFLELASCNFGEQLGHVLIMAQDALPELVVKRVRAEVRERVIESYKKYDFWWKKGTSNWTAVCINGVFGSYLNFATKEEIEEYIPEMVKSMEGFLSGFDAEGCCLEGYAYWSYGFSYFCYFADMLRNYTEGKIDLFKLERVHDIAKFQENCAINDHQCIRFCDCGEYFRPNNVLAHFLKNEYPDIEIPAIPIPSDNGAEIRSLVWLDPSLTDSSMKPKNKIYHDAQWFIYKSSEYNFACKAGHNNEPHNHNDVGSFMISKNGKVSFTDPGSGEYTRQYFSKERYTILEPSSRSHSVPIINGELQKAGVAEKATIYKEHENEYCFSMEKVYCLESLKSLKRGFVCEKNAIILTDTYEFTEQPSEVTERFVSLNEITVSGGKAFCGASVMEFDEDKFEVEITTDTCVRSASIKETLYIINLKVKVLKCNMELTFKFS